MRFLKICIFCIVFLALGITLVNVADLQKANTNLNNQLTQQEQTYSGRIDELTVYQEKLVERISLLEENYQKLQTAYDELKAAYDQYIQDSTLERETIQNTVVDLRETIAVLENNADVDAETITALRAEVTTLETSLENQTTTANELQATVTQQEATIAELNTTIDALIEELNSDLKTLQLQKFQQLFGGDENAQVELTAEDLGDITQIRPYAFYNCTNLVSIELPETCEIIGDYAFYCNQNLINVSAIGVKDICRYAFQHCSGMTFANFSSALTIGENSFINCSSLSDFRIDSPLTIGQYAFRSCPLEEFNFGTKLTSIGQYAFDGAQFETVNLPDTLTSIGASAFMNSGVVNVHIPESVTSIGATLFQGCPNIETISMPFTSSLGSLYNVVGAVTTSSSLPEHYSSDFFYIIMPQSWVRKYYIIPKALKDVKILSGTVAEYGFVSFSSLTKIDVKNCTFDGDGEFVFYNCSNLVDLQLPETYPIGESMFSGCSSLMEIEIPKGTTRIGESAFARCSSLSEIEIPNSVESIGGRAFESTNISTFEIPTSVTDIVYTSFMYTPYWNALEEDEAVYLDDIFLGFKQSSSSPLRTTLTSYSVLDGTRVIGGQAFYDLDALVSLVLPDSVEALGLGILIYTNALTELIIPKNVKLIEKFFLSSAYGITTLTFNSEIPPEIYTYESNLNQGMNNVTTINIPAGTLEAYSNANFWKDYADKFVEISA